MTCGVRCIPTVACEMPAVDACRVDLSASEMT